MGDLTFSARLGQMALFLMLSLGIVFAQLLPLNPGAGRIPGPDVMLLLTIAWLLRRPEAAPVLLIAVLFLLGDFLFMRPLGLWALVVVLMTEMIRARLPGFRDMSFFVEWLTVAAFIALGTVTYVAVQALFFVDQTALGQTLVRLVMTVLCYPIVVAAGARAFGLKKPVTGEFNPLGGRA